MNAKGIIGSLRAFFQQSAAAEASRATAEAKKQATLVYGPWHASVLAGLRTEIHVDWKSRMPVVSLYDGTDRMFQGSPAEFEVFVQTMAANDADCS